jgi:hypothetical protein
MYALSVRRGKTIDVKRISLCAAAALFTVSFFGVALAVTSDDVQNCNRPTNVERQIVSCTRALTLRGLPACSHSSYARRTISILGGLPILVPFELEHPAMSY